MVESESTALPLGDAPVINVYNYNTFLFACQVLFGNFFKFSRKKLRICGKDIMRMIKRNIRGLRNNKLFVFTFWGSYVIIKAIPHRDCAAIAPTDFSSDCTSSTPAG